MNGQKNPDLDETLIARRVLSERTRVFTDRAVAGALTSPLGTLLLAWTQAPAAGWGKAALWLCLINGVELLILGTGYRYRHAKPNDDQTRPWFRAQIVCAALVGLAWGSSVWFFRVEGQYLNYFANLVLLVGVSGVSIIIMSPFHSATVLFSFGILLPPLVQLAVYSNPYAMQIAVGLIVLFAVQIRYARDVERELLRDLDNSVRNAALVKLLSQARADLSKTNAEVEAKNVELHTALARLNELVTHDELTGAFNRRFIFDQLERQVAIQGRHGGSVCMVMFDLDHFKAINDRYGHPVGDRALREVARAVAAQLRDGDMLARIGGEEFLVLLPMTGKEAACLLADRLRLVLAATALQEGVHQIFLPASFGVAELMPDEDVAAWFRRVDAALYQAKARGRNTLVAAG